MLFYLFINKSLNYSFGKIIHTKLSQSIKFRAIANLRIIQVSIATVPYQFLIPPALQKSYSKRKESHTLQFSWLSNEHVLLL